VPHGSQRRSDGRLPAPAVRPTGARHAPGRVRSPGRRAADVPSGEVVNVLSRLLYWLAVLAVSLALLVGLILLIESRDSSSVGSGRPAAGAHV
jgi:hypothetical protein